MKKTAAKEGVAGEDFTQRLVEYLVKEFIHIHAKDPSSDVRAMVRLRNASENVKCSLSYAEEGTIDIEKFYAGIDFRCPITRTQFEDLNADLFKSALDPILSALERENLAPAAVKEVVLSGGSTRIPRLRQLVEDLLDTQPLTDIQDAIESAACGAALMGLHFCHKSVWVPKVLSAAEGMFMSDTNAIAIVRTTG